MPSYQVGFVVFLPTPFAGCTVAASPPLLQYDLGHFDLCAIRVVTLATLGAGYKSTLQIIAQRAALDAEVLFQDEVIRHGDANHLVFLLSLDGCIHPGVYLGPLKKKESSR